MPTIYESLSYLQTDIQLSMLPHYGMNTTFFTYDSSYITFFPDNTTVGVFTLKIVLTQLNTDAPLKSTYYVDVEVVA